jgi:hypothetical protein
VTWNANGETNLAGYTIHWGQSTGNYTSQTGAAATATSYRACGFVTGSYFVAVRAYNTGNDFSGYSSESQVDIGGQDTAPPQLSNRNPNSNSSNVPVNTNVSFRLSDSGAGVDISTLVVTINGSAPDNINSTGNASQYDIVCQINNNLPVNTNVIVSIHAEDLASPPNALDATYSFTTGGGTDQTLPVVSGESPGNGSVGVVTTSEITVDVSDAGAGVDLANIEFYVNNVLVPYSWTGGPSSATIRYENQSGFAPNTTMNVRVVVCDLATQPNCVTHNFSFTTGTTGGTPPSSGNELGVIAPNGYWKDDPARPMEIQNLPLSWVVRIFDMSGHEVRGWHNNQGEGTTWAWDFLNDSGERVAGGLYLIRVVAPDGMVRRNGRFVVQ